jgi:fibronectin type 3 domain-containing protein
MSAKTFFVTAIVLLGVCALIAGCGSDSVSPANTSNDAPIMPPLNVVVTPTASGKVIITWDANTQPNLRGYKVYRRDDQSIQTLTVNPISQTRYEDTATVLGATYEYRVTSVSTKGAESGFASATVTIRGTDRGRQDKKQN